MNRVPACIVLKQYHRVTRNEQSVLAVLICLGVKETFKEFFANRAEAASRCQTKGVLNSGFIDIFIRQCHVIECLLNLVNSCRMGR